MDRLVNCLKCHKDILVAGRTGADGFYVCPTCDDIENEYQQRPRTIEDPDLGERYPMEGEQ